MTPPLLSGRRGLSSQWLYQAARGRKRWLWGEGAGHNVAWVAGGRYSAALRELADALPAAADTGDSGR